MDERSQALPSNSRKRLRAEDRSGTSYKLSTSPAMAHLRDSRARSGNGSGPSEVMLPTSAESAPVLQPLHPPIPNFSAISQGAPRQNSVPTSTAELPNSMVYNIAHPLPNPGRAHRFCQACDHVNHVRRKLCANCGAPKPSAVRNAVGVRTTNESESSRDRRPRPAATDPYSFDALNQGYSRPMPYAQGGGQSIYSRQSNPHALQNDQRGAKSVDHALHQAQPLSMRCQGDDIPLPGNTQRPPAPYHFPDTPGSQRLGIGQALLNEPLINIGTVSGQDPRYQRAPVRHSLVGGAFDFNQKVFPGYGLDRDQASLPSMNGIPGQQQQQIAYQGQTGPARRASQLDLSSHPSVLSHEAKGAEGGLTEDVISLRTNFIPDMDARQGAQRFQSIQPLRQGRTDTTQQFSDSLDAQGTPAYTYPQSQELFPGQSHVRHDERISFDESRARETLPATDAIVGGKPTINLGRYMEHAPESLQRAGEDRGKATQGLSSSRGELIQSGQLHRIPAQSSSGHLDESGRQADDGRFAIDNILMQHKNGRSNQN